MAYNREYQNGLYSTWPWITTDDVNNFPYFKKLLFSVQSTRKPSPSDAFEHGNRECQGTGLCTSTNSFQVSSFRAVLSKVPIKTCSCRWNGRDQWLWRKQRLRISVYKESKGLTSKPEATTLFQGEWIFGHSGFGGQNVRVDIHNNLSYAYVSNDLKVADADLVRPWKRLVDRLYQLLWFIEQV